MDLIPYFDDLMKLVNLIIFDEKKIYEIDSKVKEIYKDDIIDEMLLQYPINKISDIKLPSTKIYEISGIKINMARFILSKIINLYTEKTPITLIDFGCGRAHIDIAILYIISKLKLPIIIKKLILVDIQDNEVYIRNKLKKLNLNVKMKYNKINYLETDIRKIVKDNEQKFIVAFHFDGGLWMKLVDDLEKIKNYNGVIFPCCYHKNTSEIKWKSDLYQKLSKNLDRDHLKIIQKNVLIDYPKKKWKNGSDIVFFFRCLISNICPNIYHIPIRSIKSLKIIKNPIDLTTDDIVLIFKEVKQFTINSYPPDHIINKQLNDIDIIDLIDRGFEKAKILFKLSTEIKKRYYKVPAMIEMSIINDTSLFMSNFARIEKGRLDGCYDRNYFLIFQSK